MTSDAHQQRDGDSKERQSGDRKIGLITYDSPHLKTEQVVGMLATRHTSLRFYALPFDQRKARPTIFRHRPDQAQSISPEVIAEKFAVPFVRCKSDLDIDDQCHHYLVLGAGILSAGCIKGKKIINAHPGVIPACRGLDSFKWAILEGKPLGVTLHYIDEHVDAGEVISVIPTIVYRTDTLETLARRHYESEIRALADFDSYLRHPVNDFADSAIGEPKKRMSNEMEAALIKQFPDYVREWGRRPSP